MSDQNGSSVSTQNVSDVPETKTSNDVVKYETYNRVLSEAKKLKDKVKEYETTLQQSQEQKLKEQNEWKALAEQYKTQLEQTKSTLNEQEKSIVNGLKFHEFEKHIGGKLKDRDYASFVDFEKIILNPETKRVDEDSVKAVAADFVKKHSSLVEFAQNGKLPNQAAGNYKPVNGGKRIEDMSARELEDYIKAQASAGLIK